MRTSEIANAAGVNVQTLRYYERRGLLPVPARRASGYREYDPTMVQRIGFIRRAQELGFTLAEIAELLELRDGAAPAHRAARPEVRLLAAAKVAMVDAKLQQLQAMREALVGLVEACDCGCGAVECPIIEALEDGPASIPSNSSPAALHRFAMTDSYRRLRCGSVLLKCSPQGADSATKPSRVCGPSFARTATCRSTT